MGGWTLALRASSGWWEWPACTLPTATQRAALMAAGIREDFLEEVTGEPGEKHSGLAHPMFLFLGLCRRFLLRRGLGLPAIVPALGPHKPQGPCLLSNVSFSSPGPTAEDGPSRRSHLLAMEPTRPAPLSRYPKSYLDRQIRECQVGGGGDTSLFCFGYFKVLNSCLVSETSWFPPSVLHFEQCGGP